MHACALFCVCMFSCVSMHSGDMCANMVEAILPVHEKKVSLAAVTKY